MNMILIFAVILFVLLIIFGGNRGAISVVALCGNILVLAVVTLLLAGGAPVLPVILVASVIISFITLQKQNGTNYKTNAAFLSVAVIMVLFTGIIYLFVWGAGLGGLNEIRATQDDVMYYYTVDIHINMLQVTIGITLLSVLGAVIDTALSVTSAVYEVSVHKPDLSMRELFYSGMQVGREIIGTTVNTLVFAYFGESILLFAYLQIGKYTIANILNSKFLLQEISVMLFGALACLITVPVSAICIGYFIRKKPDRLLFFLPKRVIKGRSGMDKKIDKQIEKEKK